MEYHKLTKIGAAYIRVSDGRLRKERENEITQRFWKCIKALRQA